MSKEIQNSKISTEEISTKDLILRFKSWTKYIWGYKLRIFLVLIIGGILGYIYSRFFSKPVYTSVVSFTLEQKNSGASGALGGLASSLGLGDLPTNSSNGMFGGENVLYLLKSNRIIHQSLKEPQIDLNGDHLLNSYVQNHYERGLQEKKIRFYPKILDSVVFNRAEDSLLLAITKLIREKQIVAERLDKKTTIINLDVKDVNEQWAYLFSKALVKNAIDLYLEIKIGKLLRAEEELTKKRDSIRGLLDGSITTLAFETDLNSHTPLMRYKTNQVKKQIDVEVLKSMYANVIQNLEITKIQRAQEEPIIEIIDEPILPLKKDKIGIAKGVIFGSVTLTFLFLTVLIFRRVLREILV
jgi:Chain length determinant protein